MQDKVTSCVALFLHGNTIINIHTVCRSIIELKHNKSNSNHGISTSAIAIKNFIKIHNNRSFCVPFFHYEKFIITCTNAKSGSPVSYICMSFLGVMSLSFLNKFSLFVEYRNSVSKTMLTELW